MSDRTLPRLARQPRQPRQPRQSRLPRLALAVALSLGGFAAAVHAADAPPVSADPALEARMMSLASELRCVVCQNQTIADSHAELAADLRQQMREQLAAGRSDEEVRRYLTDRYGDFVLYRPPVKPLTWLLWFGPPALLLLGAAGLLTHLRRRQTLAPDAFEPDTPADAAGDAADVALDPLEIRR